MESTLVLIGSGCLVCLMPLAIYLLYLANLNSKPHPVMVPGGWDFAATLLGLSGFLVLSGPLLLTLIDSRWRSHVYGSWTELRNFGTREARAWSLMSCGYLLLLLGLIPGLIRSRRTVTAIYNLDAGILENCLDFVLNGMGLKVVARGSSRTITDEKTDKVCEARIEGFRVMNHSAIHWSGDWSETRSLVEVRLEKHLRNFVSPPPVIAGWLHTAAVTIMVIVLSWMIVLVMMMAYVR